MKLEPKHIAAYLPYGLMVSASDYDLNISEFIGEVCSWELNDAKFKVWSSDGLKGEVIGMRSIRPILRPISSMTKEEAYEFGVLLLGEAEMEDKEVGIGDMAVMGDVYPTIMYEDQEDEDYSVMIQFSSIGISVSGIDIIPHEAAYEWLFSKHFDIFGLIEQGLAIEK